MKRAKSWTCALRTGLACVLRSMEPMLVQLATHWLVLTASLVGIACQSVVEPPDRPDPCRDLAPVAGKPVCKAGPLSATDFEALSVPGHDPPGVTRATKFLVPLDESAKLPALFQNVQLYPLHYDFLKAHFAATLGVTSPAAYEALVFWRPTRRHAAGFLARLAQPCQGAKYGFSLFQPPTKADRFTATEVQGIAATLAQATALGPLVYLPLTGQDRLDADGWGSLPGLKVQDCVQLDAYQAYTQGVAYGYLRILPDAAFAIADAGGELGWQDIVVVPGVPFDLQSVVAGIVTGQQQGTLSHVNVRTLRRGTPNLYVAGAADKLAALQGKLVRLEAAAGDWSIHEVADLAEAEAFWAQTRPSLGPVPPPDWSSDEIVDLEAIPTATPEQRALSMRRYGGKSVHLAGLRQRLHGPLVVAGAAVPMAWYRRFLDENVFEFEVDGAKKPMSYAQYGQWLLSRPEIQQNRPLRVLRLHQLSEHMRTKGQVPAGVVTQLAGRIVATFGDETSMVRLRSSANVEDGVLFSAAGLHESASGCVVDSYVALPGPSACDPASPRRPLQAALKKVWASLWLPRAYEERLYYGHPAMDDVAMGMLVSPAFGDERVNGVAFSGDPVTSGQDDPVVTSMPGDNSVVRPDPGAVPETVRLVGDQVVRVQASNLVAPGQFVITDAEFVPIRQALARIEAEVPIDAPPDLAGTVLHDIEFKLDQDGTLRLKQIRPFLRAAAKGPPGVRLHVATDKACGGWLDFRTLDEEQAVKVQLTLATGEHPLPATGPLPSLALVQQVRFGPQGEELQPLGPPTWTRQEETVQGKAYLKFQYDQHFGAGQTQVDLSWTRTVALSTDGRGDAWLDEASLVGKLVSWKAKATVAGQVRPLAVGSCTGALLLPHQRIVHLAGGGRIELDLRYTFQVLSSSPAVLTRARLLHGGVDRTVEGYFSLVYSADHHNWNERYRLVLDPPAAGWTAVDVVEGPQFGSQLPQVLVHTAAGIGPGPVATAYDEQQGSP